MTPEQQKRYDRWRKASDMLALEHEGHDFEDLVIEEQAAWDDMADNDDPEYVNLLNLVKGVI